MHYVITFVTDKFDVTKEDENPINPIYGQSLLLWLKEQVAETVNLESPDTEDWGWYTTIDWKGRSYILGASAAESENGSFEWVFQVDKNRTFKEKLLGREKMKKDDECLLFFQSVFDSEPEFMGVAVE
jgi:hypothetical protein